MYVFFKENKDVQQQLQHFSECRSRHDFGAELNINKYELYIDIWHMITTNDYIQLIFVKVWRKILDYIYIDRKPEL